MPLDGSTVYVTLYSNVDGSYSDGSGYIRNSYTYTAARSASISSPGPVSVLSSTAATFTWSAVTGATEYWLDVGTSAYVGNIASGPITGTSRQVTGLPYDGSTIYATLYTKLNGSYQDATGAYVRNLYTYTATRIATMISPAPNSTFTSSNVTFTWIPVPGANGYWLDVGTKPFVGDISYGPTFATSSAFFSLPMDGNPVYVTLYTKLNGSYQSTSGAYLRNLYTYTPVKVAALTAPTGWATG